jgi:hypothetical protein
MSEQRLKYITHVDSDVVHIFAFDDKKMNFAVCGFSKRKFSSVVVEEVPLEAKVCEQCVRMKGRFA